MKKLTTALAFLFLALVFFSPAKSFALMEDISATELAQEAKIIVQGEVKSVRSYKGINDIIYTRASVLVSDIFKGKIAKKNITVEYRGGEIGSPRSSSGVAGNLGLSIEDEPTLEKGESRLMRGEQVLLFLTNSFWRKNIYYIVGGISGKYTLNNTNQEKQTLDELLSEIENAE